MPAGQQSDGASTSWYRNHIGDPATDDEVTGYWIFALGVVLGAVGIVVFLGSRPAGAVRQWAIVIAAAGLALVFAGPIIRLPLRRAATWLVYLGVLLCAAAIVWFIAAFPSQWSPQSGQPTIIGLYAAGLLVMGVGAVLVPILTDRAELEATVSALQTELDGLREALRGTEADEADLADVIRDLRRALADTEADESDLAHLVDQLRAGLADTEADEADLAAQLRSLRASQSRFELYQSRDNEWRWRLRHRNGNIIADSSEGYTRKHNAQKGLEAVRRDALGGSVLLIETEEELPAANEEFEPLEDTASRADFELYEDNAGQFRWRLRHDNGNIIADSGEGYASRNGATSAIDGIREYVGPADYLRADPTAIEVYRDQAGEWRWRLVHRNGNILADSGEGYSQRSNARRAIDRIREGVEGMEFEVYEDNSGEYRWRLRGGNQQIMADSGEGYESQSGATEAVDRVRDYMPDADLLDIGRAVFEVYADQADEWRWRLRHRNGRILADSGQGYSDRSGAWEGINSVKRNAPNADTETIDS